MSEPRILVNGHPLTEAQAMTLRVALGAFNTCLDEGLGDDEHGKTMVRGYRERIVEILRCMQPCGPHPPGQCLRCGRTTARELVIKRLVG